jgi:hypothetical protein
VAELHIAVESLGLRFLCPHRARGGCKDRLESKVSVQQRHTRTFVRGHIRGVSLCMCVSLLWWGRLFQEKNVPWPAEKGFAAADSRERSAKENGRVRSHVHAWSEGRIKFTRAPLD